MNSFQRSLNEARVATKATIPLVQKRKPVNLGKGVEDSSLGRNFGREKLNWIKVGDHEANTRMDHVYDTELGNGGRLTKMEVLSWSRILRSPTFAAWLGLPCLLSVAYLCCLRIYGLYLGSHNIRNEDALIKYYEEQGRSPDELLLERLVSPSYDFKPRKSYLLGLFDE